MSTRRLTRVLASATLAIGTLMTGGTLAQASTPVTADDGGQGIVGGTEVTTPYPWMAHLRIYQGTSVFGCGGSLISPDTILTAAHCLQGSQPTSKVDLRIGSLDKSSGGITRTSTTWRIGPGPKNGDWAVIKIDPVTNVTPMRMPSGTGLNSGPSFRTMGWGYTYDGGGASQTLRQVDVPFVSDSLCGTGTNEICAGDWDNGGIDSCGGDSGGPLLNRASDGNWTLVGIVSWGVGCAKPKYPGHYTEVTTYQTAINNAITAMGGTLPGDSTTPPAPGDGVTPLSNGVAVTGLSGASGSEVFYKVDVPAGASSLSISTSGGTGDMDLYTKYGAKPTNTSYDCRPYRSGNTETCTVSAPQAGTYYVRLKGYTSYSGASLVARWN